VRLTGLANKADAVTLATRLKGIPGFDSAKIAR